METTLEANPVELTNKVLDETRFDVEIAGPVADNVLAGIHPNNWNANNSRFLKTPDDSRNYIMAVLAVVDDPVAHTANVVENAVATYYEKGGQIPDEGFVAASAAYHITSRFLFQTTVENAVAEAIDETVYEPATHEAHVGCERNGFDIITRAGTIQIKTGAGTESDEADERIYVEVDGRTLRWERG